jgi:hypothetical protein
VPVWAGSRIGSDKHVLEAPNLKEGGDEDALRVGPQAHGAGEESLVKGNTSVGVDADEI